LHYDRKKRKLYFLDEIYELSLSNREAAKRIQNRHKGRMLTRLPDGQVTCDNGEPKSIQELKFFGLNTTPSKKGPDSIHFGIKFLQDLTELVFDKRRTPNAYKEFHQYEYEVDRNGKYRSTYPNKNNHAIDCTRYAMENDMLNNRMLFSSIKI